MERENLTSEEVEKMILDSKVYYVKDVEPRKFEKKQRRLKEWDLVTSIILNDYDDTLPFTSEFLNIKSYFRELYKGNPLTRISLIRSRIHQIRGNPASMSPRQIIDPHLGG
jgi:hypothetical protein